MLGLSKSKKTEVKKEENTTVQNQTQNIPESLVVQQNQNQTVNSQNFVEDHRERIKRPNFSYRYIIIYMQI